MNGIARQTANDYVAEVLMLYLRLPETPHKAAHNDRIVAKDFHERGIHIGTIEAALLLASVRRLGRSSRLPPLSPIRSLAYFLPVLEEILFVPINDDYLNYLRLKVGSLCGK